MKAFLLGALALGALGAVLIAQENSSPAPRVVEMTAANYEFTPSVVQAHVGETIELKVRAIDKEHGIRLNPAAKGTVKGSAPGLEITSKEDCVKFKKNETGTIDLVARAPGTYEFECCKLCGLGHGKMKGEVVVEP